MREGDKRAHSRRMVYKRVIMCVQVHCAMNQKRWHIMYTRLLVCVCGD